MACNRPQSKRYDYPKQRRTTSVNAKHVAVCRNELPDQDFTVVVEVRSQADVVVFTHTPTVTDGAFVIPSMVFTDAGLYEYEVIFTYLDGTVKIYMFGDIDIKERF